jgi:ABC-type transport system involved in cytochrome c biogenesis permease component
VNALPVIERELRAEARHSANYWLRVLAAGSVIVVFASIMIGAQVGGSQLGMILFSGLYRTFSYALWILVPLMTADCVSRERREGTLGLLFLTPLRVLDVIAGKATIHVLRAGTLFLAALPVLGLPLTLGGVEWRWGLFAALALGNAALMAIGAGIYASCRGGSTIQVMVLAEACAWGLAVASGLSSGLIYFLVRATPLRGYGPFPSIALELLFSGLVFALLLRASVRRLRDKWHEDSPAPEQPRWVRTWIEILSESPLLQGIFRWNKSRTLDRNPVAWLQEYSWTARLTKWGWFGLALLAVFFELVDADSRGLHLRHFLITSALTLGVAFSAAGSFRREHHTGLLEQLLVTPLTVRQILGGRLWGMFGHYLPALAVLWFGWIGVRLLSAKLQANDIMTAMFPNPLTFLTLMIAGLYLSLGRVNFFLAWLITWVATFLVPVAATVALHQYTAAGERFIFGVPLVFQAGLAAVLWLLLYRDVRQRSFLLIHTAGA